MLRIHETALELIRDVVPLLDRIDRRDPDLARQGRRALMSVPLNIAEGSDQPGKRRALHYRIALGSARESWSVLRSAPAAQCIEGSNDELTNKLDTVIGTLHRCVFTRR